MRFDLTGIDFTKEVTGQLINQYFKIISHMIEDGTYDNDLNRNVTLFHGTNLLYMNNILLNGLVPRNQSDISNYEGELKSSEYLVYLTNKWHYFYSLASCNNLTHKGKTAKDFNLPCYVECVVPFKELVLDEDFFHSYYIKNRIKNCIRKNNPVLEITAEECLSQYATIAHLGTVNRKNIKSFTLLANIPVLTKRFMNPDTQYQKDLAKWGSGKGKGDLRLMDLLQLEDDEYNRTFWMKDIPTDSIITKVIPKEDINSYSLQFNRVEFQKS